MLCVFVLLLGAAGLGAQDLQGVASVYGDQFTGRKTSSGELYDPTKFTAAHRTLPFGSQVEVTNLSNGLKTTVTVTDRGPWVEGRLIDLSRAAAQALKIDGLAQVSLRLVSGPAAPPVDGSRVYLQVGAYRSLAHAQARLAALDPGQSGEIWVDQGLYRVYVVSSSAPPTGSPEAPGIRVQGAPPGTRVAP